MRSGGVGLSRGHGPGPGRRRGRSCTGRVRVWVPFLIVFVAGVWLFESLAGTVRAAEFTTIDPRRARFFDPAEVPDAPGGGGFVDQRWEQELRRALAAAGPFEAHDDDGAREVVARVAALPFVAAVGVPEVVWPDGLELGLKLRVPAACVRVGELYYAVSEDAVLLPGAWSAPPWIGQGYLPVLGPNDGAFELAQPGERLGEARHLDALSVARSMRAALTAAEFEVLGPPLIDATTARLSSAREPGTRIALPGKRVIWFGRAPDCGEPGELPVEQKWAAVVRALHLTGADTGGRSWQVLDVRWDVPALQWRTEAGG